MLDRIRKDIEDRLRQLLTEADKLRRALEALDPRDKPAARRVQQSPAAASPPKPRTPALAPTPTPRQRASSSSSSAPAKAKGAERPARTPQGATKARVLAALSSNRGMTASEVATATGLGRGSVSTTLSKLAKTGEVTKAARGYQLPAATASAPRSGNSTDS